VLCVRCHAADLGKPKTVPLVVSADHSGGVVCDTCHQPHNPEIASGEANEQHPRQLLILLPATAMAWDSILAGTPEASPNYKMTITGGAC